MEEKLKNAAHFALMQRSSKDVKAFFCEIMLTMEREICPHHYAVIVDICDTYERMEKALEETGKEAVK